MVYAVGALSGYSGANKLTIQRVAGGTDNGSVVVTAENMQGRNLGFLGDVTGSVSVVLGTTDSGAASERKVYAASGTRIDVKDAASNISFNNSSGLQINLLDNENEANIAFQGVSNSTLDATGTSRELSLQTSAGSNNNIFNMGWGDLRMIDGGSYNVTSLGSGTSYYASMTTSTGAVVLGGSGNGTYHIGGNLGVFQQGTGYADYQINSATGDVNTGWKNAIISTSVSNITDQGQNSLLVSLNSASTLTANGVNSVGILGSLAQVVQGRNNKSTMLFAGGQTERWVDDTDHSMGKYILSDELQKQGWSNLHLNSDGSIADNYYFGGGTSLHDKHNTGNIIRNFTALTTYLAIGDKGTDARLERA